VYAVWKTDRPFDAGHYAWEPAAATAAAAAAEPLAGTGDEGAVGHKRDEPAGKVVTTATPTVEPTAPAVNPPPPASRAARPRVDYAFLREQISMERVLAHLGLLERLRGGGQQRRGPCPLHSHPAAAERTFSVHLSKGAFRCFHAECAARGNALDLWAAVHRLPLYDAALHLAETFGLRRNREEGPVPGTRHPQGRGVLSPAVRGAAPDPHGTLLGPRSRHRWAPPAWPHPPRRPPSVPGPPTPPAVITADGP